MSEVIKSYRELRVYRTGFESAKAIFELSTQWPKEERYSLTDQIRRSSRSVCGNIAEAWRKRRYPAHFVSKLSDADAEATETEVWLDFAKECQYLSEETHRQLRNKYDHICGMLTNMINHPDDWCNKFSKKQTS